MRQFDQGEYEQVFEYLDDLRESGVTNMFGAGSYVARALDYSAKDADQLVVAWMKSFDGSSSVEQRAEAALAAQRENANG